MQLPVQTAYPSGRDNMVELRCSAMCDSMWNELIQRVSHAHLPASNTEAQRERRPVPKRRARSFRQNEYRRPCKPKLQLVPTCHGLVIFYVNAGSEHARQRFFFLVATKSPPMAPRTAMNFAVGEMHVPGNCAVVLHTATRACRQVRHIRRHKGLKLRGAACPGLAS